MTIIVQLSFQILHSYASWKYQQGSHRSTNRNDTLRQTSKPIMSYLYIFIYSFIYFISSFFATSLCMLEEILRRNFILDFDAIVLYFSAGFSRYGTEIHLGAFLRNRTSGQRNGTWGMLENVVLFSTFFILSSEELSKNPFHLLYVTLIKTTIPKNNFWLEKESTSM